MDNVFLKIWQFSPHPFICRKAGRVQPLHEICENTGFQWPVFSRITTQSTILSLFGRIRVTENPYSCIFYAVNFHPIFFLAILKTKNTGTGNGMRGMRGTRGMFTMIPGNLLEGSGECSYFKIPGNVQEDEKKRNC